MANSTTQGANASSGALQIKAARLPRKKGMKSVVAKASGPTLPSASLGRKKGRRGEMAQSSGHRKARVRKRQTAVELAPKERQTTRNLGALKGRSKL